LKVLATSSLRAAAAALSLLGCASEDAAQRLEFASLRAEVRALQQGNAELSRKVDALSDRVEVLAAKPPAPPPAPAAAPVPTPAPPAQSAQPLVPSGLKVVRLEPGSKRPKASKSVRAKRANADRGEPPPVPTATAVRDPDAATLTALGAGGKDLASEAEAALARARSLSGLGRAKALEEFAGRYPGHSGAQGALVGAARTRFDAGDPDGSCEDYGRAVREYPAGNSMPDALSGLASCERRAGREGEASRLESRLAQDYPDSVASRRAPARADPAPGAAP